MPAKCRTFGDAPKCRKKKRQETRKYSLSPLGSRLQYVPVVSPWPTSWNFLSFSFLVCKMGTIRVPHVTELFWGLNDAGMYTLQRSRRAFYRQCWSCTLGPVTSPFPSWPSDSTIRSTILTKPGGQFIRKNSHKHCKTQ